MKLKSLAPFLLCALFLFSCLPTSEPLDGSDIATLNPSQGGFTLSSVETLERVVWGYEAQAAPPDCELDEFVFCEVFPNAKESRLENISEDTRVLVVFDTPSGRYELKNF